LRAHAFWNQSSLYTTRQATVGDFRKYPNTGKCRTSTKELTEPCTRMGFNKRLEKMSQSIFLIMRHDSHKRSFYIGERNTLTPRPTLENRAFVAKLTRLLRF
jgi:hypothetical protein